MLATANSRNNYATVGSLGPYPYTFKIWAASDLRVVKRSAAGLETVLNYPADFSVTGIGKSAGGNVTLTVNPLASDLLSIRRLRPLTQTTDLRNQGTYFREDTEDALDKLLMICQQQQDEISRSFKIDESLDPSLYDLVVPLGVNGQVLGWGPGGLTNFYTDAGAVALPGNGRTTVTLSQYLANNAIFNVKDFGAVGNGVANDTVPIANAVAAAKAAKKTLYFPAGSYVTDQFTIDWDGAVVLTEGLATKFLARANNQIIFKLAASYCDIASLWVDANGFTGVNGFVCAPANELDHATRVDQNYNRVGKIHAEGCAEGFRMRAGPGTLTGDSGCWYNLFYGIDCRNCSRGFWLQSPVANAGGGATAGSLVNRNTFFAIRVGQSTNTGMQIDAGGTNSFHHIAFEGVASGVTPNATPRALYIIATDPVSGFNNDGNKFYAVDNEANTVDVNCANLYTEFYGLNSTGGAKLVGAFFATANTVGVCIMGAYGKTKLNALEYDPTAVSPVAGYTISTSLQADRLYSRKQTFAGIAAAGTFDIVLPAGWFGDDVCIELQVKTNWNATLVGKYLISTDGATLVIDNVKAMAGIVLAAVGGMTVRITNNVGGPAKFTTSLLRSI